MPQSLSEVVPVGDAGAAGQTPPIEPASLRELESATVFRGWSVKAEGDRRDVAAAGRVLEALLDGAPRRPTVVVTGSKGKGHVATAIAARLSAAGVRTGLVTSPGIVSHLDRWALDGRVLPEEAYRRGLRRLREALAAVNVPEGSYLAPTGLFTVLGHAMLAEAGAEVVVHEAGMGGAHDEVSLFDPLAVALTSVFAEHLDVFGPTLEHVAREKFGLVHGPAPVCSVPQHPSIADLLVQRCAAEGAPLRIAPEGPFPAQNDAVAWDAARAALDWLGRAEPEPSPRVVLTRPGRGQPYALRTGGTAVVDACIDPVGFRAVLDGLSARGLAVSRVYWSVPVTKDVRGIAGVLRERGLPETFVALEDPEHEHLDYRLPAGFRRAHRILGLREFLTELDRPREALGETEGDGVVVVAGTISFGTAVLRHLGVGVHRLYEVGPAR